jgi:succinate dehydrogenase / fumarate reductase cytochrome b subunit
MSVTEAQRGRRTGARELWDSTIGKKIAVAVTGAIMVLYVILHMVGNLNSLYGNGGGDARVDRYAEWLRTFGEPLLPRSFVLWVIRAILIFALVIHVTGIVQLTRRNRAARGGHAARRMGRSFSSATALLTGLLLLAFIIFHILQFTTLTIDVTPLKQGAVYSNLYYAFHKWYFVLLYVLAVGSLGFHLRHGIWSMVQTLGWDRPERNLAIRRTAGALALAVVVGFILVPILFWTGALSKPVADNVQASATPVVVNR